MAEALASVDRFFRIIAGSDDRNSQRLMQEWSYLHTLLSSQPVAYDRIEAYLNILESHDSNTRRHVREAKRSLTEHPRAKELAACVGDILGVLEGASWDKND